MSFSMNNREVFIYKRFLEWNYGVFSIVNFALKCISGLCPRSCNREFRRKFIIVSMASRHTQGSCWRETSSDRTWLIGYEASSQFIQSLIFCILVNCKIPRHVSEVISHVLAKTVKIRCVRCVCKTAAKCNCQLLQVCLSCLPFVGLWWYVFILGIFCKIC